MKRNAAILPAAGKHWEARPSGISYTKYKTNDRNNKSRDA
tara:strand:- start:334512 stop:334631 length:120 start_codon:yes stop_codon:yes gene_type:complete